MSTSNKPILMVIDGHSLAFRAFYALAPESFKTSAGQYTNAIHGFISMLLSLLQTEKPTHLAIAFDPSRHSFRTEKYPEYKGTRAETPEEFKGQVELLDETLTALGIKTITITNFEADDVLASLSRQGNEAGYEVLLVSGDRDTIQLITPTTTLLYPIKGVSELKRYDAEAVAEKYGVQPAQYPELAALVGETSDNLPGVPGVGPKTAAKWINQFGGLAELYHRVAEVGGKVGDALRENLDLVKRNRELNRLVQELELPVTLDDLELKPSDAVQLENSFNRLQFRKLKEQAKKVLLGATVSAETVKKASITAAPATLLTEEKEILDWLRVSGKLVSIWVADDSIGLADANNRADLSSANLSEAMRDWLAGTAEKALLDGKLGYKTLAANNIQISGIAHDTLLANQLIFPNINLKGVAEQISQFLGEELATAPSDQLFSFDLELSASEYAWYVYRICIEQQKLLDDNAKKVLTELEIPLIPIFAELELSGIAIDQKKLTELFADLSNKVAQIEQSAYEAIGQEVNLSSPKQLQEVLFNQLGLKPTKTTKSGGYTTNAEAIIELSQQYDHPFLQFLLAHRDANKLKQITESLLKSIAQDGRIHTTFHQLGASTGRLSSNDPNLQNIPVKTDVGKQIRSVFIPGTAYETLLTADYSQIEMRIMAHLSGDSGLIAAFNAGEDLHNFVGAKIFEVEPEAVTGQMRTKVKAMSYGLVYGLSAYGLSRQLRIDPKEAKQLMVDYFARFGAVRDYLRQVVDKARIDGFTETIFGRRRYFPELSSSNRLIRDAAERAALNAPIQGSAADIVKRAMLAISQELAEQGLHSRMLLQVHDELVCEVAAGELEQMQEILVRNMRGAADLSVPLDVQVGIGANWDLAAH